MRRLGRWALIAVCVAGACPPSARAAGLRDLDDGWLLTVSEQHATLAGVDSVTATSRGWSAWVGIGQMRLFGMPELPVGWVGGGLRWRRASWIWRLDLSWQRTGQSLFHEDVWRLGLEIGAACRFGVLLTRRRTSFADRNADGYLLPAVRVTVPLDWLGVRCGRLEMTMHVLEPPVRFGRPGRRSLLRVVRSGGPLAAALTLEDRRDGVLVVGMDVLVRMAGHLGVGLRVDPVTGTLGPTTVWRLGSLLIRSSHVAHPDLGVTHRFALVAGGLEGAR